jgi:hypothetical protein
MSEHDEQCSLFDWARLQQNIYPELAYLYAIPNGGHRHRAVAAKLNAEGVKAGVLDLALPVARGGYIGFWGEMKFGKNDLTDSQRDWKAAMELLGHKVVVAWDWETMRDELISYLGKPVTVTVSGRMRVIG